MKSKALLIVVLSLLSSCSKSPSSSTSSLTPPSSFQGLTLDYTFEFVTDLNTKINDLLADKDGIFLSNEDIASVLEVLSSNDFYINQVAVSKNTSKNFDDNDDVYTITEEYELNRSSSNYTVVGEGGLYTNNVESHTFVYSLTPYPESLYYEEKTIYDNDDSSSLNTSYKGDLSYDKYKEKLNLVNSSSFISSMKGEIDYLKNQDYEVVTTGVITKINKDITCEISSKSKKSYENEKTIYEYSYQISILNGAISKLERAHTIKSTATTDKVYYLESISKEFSIMEQHAE